MFNISPFNLSTFNRPLFYIVRIPPPPPRPGWRWVWLITGTDSTDANLLTGVSWPSVRFLEGDDMQTFTIKSRDRLPPLRVQLIEDNGYPANLTDATVRFIMKRNPNASPVVDAQATILDPLNGVVEYAWQAGDTDSPGMYVAEFEVTYPDGTIKTYPGYNYIYIRIAQDLA